MRIKTLNSKNKDRRTPTVVSLSAKTNDDEDNTGDGDANLVGGDESVGNSDAL